MTDSQNPPESERFAVSRIYGDGSVYLPCFAASATATVLLTKLSSLLAPFNLYFTFTDLVKSGEGGYGVLPFLIKLAIPFTVGCASWYFFRERDALLLPNTNPHGINIELAASAGAGLGALLLSWPALILWELVVSKAIYLYRIQFLIVYALYIVSFTYVACAGVLSSRMLWIQDSSREDNNKRLKGHYRAVFIVYIMIVALATGGLADWASKQLSPG